MSILIYKSDMYSEASLDPERYTFKVEQKARNQWVSTHARQIGQFEDDNNPPHNTHDEKMEMETERENLGNREATPNRQTHYTVAAEQRP